MKVEFRMNEHPNFFVLTIFQKENPVKNTIITKKCSDSETPVLQKVGKPGDPNRK
jgi:hypothetical protein